MSDEKLLDCPFCGNKAILLKRGNSISYFVVKCVDCRVEMKGTAQKDAIDAWNRREPSPIVPIIGDKRGDD